MIANCTYGARNSNNEADAAFIVRTVNAHDDLLAALQNSQRWLCKLAGDQDENDPNGIAQSCCRQIERNKLAIASATA